MKCLIVGDGIVMCCAVPTLLPQQPSGPHPLLLCVTLRIAIVFATKTEW